MADGIDTRYAAMAIRKWLELIFAPSETAQHDGL